MNVNDISEKELKTISDEIVRQLMAKWRVPLDKDGEYIIPGHAASTVYNAVNEWLRELGRASEGD